MTLATFSEALRRVLAHEGGYTNHPADPGGPTNFGITIIDYRRYVNTAATAADVRSMSVQEAEVIYRTKYWQALRCDELPAGVDYAIFDYGVNSGVGRAGKVLRRALGLPDNSGSVTAAVAAAACRAEGRRLIAAICDERLAFLKSLKTWPVFGVGWARRVADVRSVALIMAGKPEAAAGGGATSARPAKAVVAGTVVVAAMVATQHAGGFSATAVVAAVAVLAVTASCGWLVWRRLRRNQGAV